MQYNKSPYRQQQELNRLSNIFLVVVGSLIIISLLALGVSLFGHVAL